MEAIRQIIKVKNHSVLVSLPTDFKADKVEVIVLPVDENQSLKNHPIANLRGKLNLSEEQYVNFQNYINNSREEWNRSI